MKMKELEWLLIKKKKKTTILSAVIFRIKSKL